MYIHEATILPLNNITRCSQRSISMNVIDSIMPGLHQIRTTASVGTRAGTIMNTCGQRWMPRVQGAGSSFRITGHVTDSVC